MLATLTMPVRPLLSGMPSYETYHPGFDPSMCLSYKNCEFDHIGHSLSNSRRGSELNSPTGSPPRNILILGATGVVGSYVTRAVIDAHSQGYFDKISIYTTIETLTTKLEDIAALEACGVEVSIGTVSDEKRFKDACRGVDTIVCCLGRAAIEQQIPLSTWAEEAGVTRFFASEFGTDIEYFPESQHEPPHQIKLKVRAHLRQMRKLQHTFIVTGPYSDLFFSSMTEAPTAGGFDISTSQAHMLGDGDGPISFTAMNDVGKFVVAALINHTVSRNATLVVHSFTATPNEICAEFERQTHTKFERSYLSTEALEKWEEEAYQIYSPLATVLTLRRIWTKGGTLHKFYDDSLLGFVETETLHDQVKLNISKQKGQIPEGRSLMRSLSAV